MLITFTAQTLLLSCVRAGKESVKCQISDDVKVRNHQPFIQNRFHWTASRIQEPAVSTSDIIDGNQWETS